MGWLGSILVAVLTGGLGLLAAGLVMNLCVGWYRVSHFEGKAGYAVVAVALLGGIAGLVLGLVVARLAPGSLGSLGVLGTAFGIVILAGALSAAIARALADIPPTIDGKELTLEVEVRLPRGASVSPRGESYLHLHSVVRGVARRSRLGELRPAEARLEDGRWIVPGSAHVFTERGLRSLGIVLSGQAPFGFTVPLPARPRPGNETWSEWLPRPRVPDPPWPDSKPSFRFRVRRVCDSPSPFPAELAARLSGFPPALRALIEAEIAAGNEIVEVASCYPAPPAGLYVKLARPVTTRPRESGDGISFVDRGSSLCSGEFSDERRFHFVLEPPRPPEPEPDMDAIRAGRVPARAVAAAPSADSPVARFAASMRVDYEKWHDGVGYDLDALHAASASDRSAIEEMLLARGATGWRDVEALAALGTPRAQAALREAAAKGSHEVRMAVMAHAPDLLSEGERTKALVAALREADLYGGLTQALARVASHHPPEVVDALLRGTLARSGEVAVHYAAMLFHIHGRAKEPFDWEQRPFFLRFHTEDRREREEAFRELCVACGIDGSEYLAG